MNLAKRVIKFTYRKIKKILRINKVYNTSGVQQISSYKDGIYYLYAACEAPPPNTIPPEHFDQFTMSGKIPVLYIYFDERKNIKYNPYEKWQDTRNAAIHNTSKTYSDMFIRLKEKKAIYYGNEINAFYDALEKYPLEGKEVLIWGLAGCNCDAIALYYNAKKVYVVDYNKPICDHERIEVLSLDEVKTLNIKTDIAFSYSSFEHDGLGRYGDPIDPDGDFKAMQEAWDRLKEDGLLFLGVPLGKDCIYWNANRVYGSIRLPLLLKGFHVIDVYNIHNSVHPGEEYPFDIPLGGHIQCIMICKKISSDYPENSISTQKENTGNTHDTLIFKNINKIVRK